MPQTKVKIVSDALMLLGKKPIQTLVNQGEIVTAASEKFDFLLPNVLSQNSWRFACTIQQLSQIVPAPIGGYWMYAYQLPANYLKLIHLWPQTYDFEIYENNKIYSNFSDAVQPFFIEYVFQPPVQNIPDYFTKYFAYEIATELALSSAQSANYYQVLEPKRGIELARAQAADAQNRPQTPLQSVPWLARRYVSTFASG